MSHGLVVHTCAIMVYSGTIPKPMGSYKEARVIVSGVHVNGQYSQASWNTVRSESDRFGRYWGEHVENRFGAHGLPRGRGWEANFTLLLEFVSSPVINFYLNCYVELYTLSEVCLSIQRQVYTLYTISNCEYLVYRGYMNLYWHNTVQFKFDFRILSCTLLRAMPLWNMLGPVGDMYCCTCEKTKNKSNITYLLSFWLHSFSASEKVRIPLTGLTTPVGWLSLLQLTVHRFVVIGFGCVFVLSLCFFFNFLFV